MILTGFISNFSCSQNSKRHKKNKGSDFDRRFSDTTFFAQLKDVPVLFVEGLIRHVVNLSGT